jgi:hypothetical protein
MAKYKKIPVVIDATQWFKNGDHPEDNSNSIELEGGGFELSEGEIVRRFRRPDVDDTSRCEKCNKVMGDHGWIDTLEGGHIVCPGDFIITGIANEKYPCKPDIFRATYEPVDEEGKSLWKK